jgi:hypothetical protein
MLTVSITGLKNKIEKLCQLRDKLTADLKLAIASSQHQALTLGLADVMRMSDVEAIETFKRVRWQNTDGQPFCSRCGCFELYTCKAESLWNCKGCCFALGDPAVMPSGRNHQVAICAVKSSASR